MQRVKPRDSYAGAASSSSAQSNVIAKKRRHSDDGARKKQKQGAEEHFPLSKKHIERLLVDSMVVFFKEQGTAEPNTKGDITVKVPAGVNKNVLLDAIQKIYNTRNFDHSVSADTIIFTYYHWPSNKNRVVQEIEPIAKVVFNKRYTDAKDADQSTLAELSGEDEIEEDGVKEDASEEDKIEEDEAELAASSAAAAAAKPAQAVDRQPGNIELSGQEVRQYLKKLNIFVNSDNPYVQPLKPAILKLINEEEACSKQETAQREEQDRLDQATLDKARRWHLFAADILAKERQQLEAQKAANKMIQERLTAAQSMKP